MYPGLVPEATAGNDGEKQAVRDKKIVDHLLQLLLEVQSRQSNSESIQILHTLIYWVDDRNIICHHHHYNHHHHHHSSVVIESID